MPAGKVLPDVAIGICNRGLLEKMPVLSVLIGKNLSRQSPDSRGCDQEIGF
ncbi:hypothetical protein [Microcoleus sp. FACHB-68]|uniref:hypothetical protein n=1 Tax=Microcoleus sp. FACHB-68 TaxID=2692826 RepID=UPI001684DFCD|nr:hypothetical protein [Microcoleus sp. FACHB-68]MBD1940617.1 hypothetical protein [Microcoleus sp. FACHB-68]